MARLLRALSGPCSAAALVALTPSPSMADAGAGDGGLGPPPSAADVIATWCGDPELQCAFAPLSYSKTIELPIAFDWDTGWIPGGSDLQVRFYVRVPAETTVKLQGSLEASWPRAMTLATPGMARGGGLIAFDYGLEVGAKMRFDILGIGWQGDIPFVPQVDFHLKSATSFRSWAFAPEPGSTSAFTQPVRLFSVNVLGLAGIPSAVAEGGVALDVRGELRATYVTDRIRIEPVADGEADVLSETDRVQRAFPGGPFVEYDVWPEGTVSYEGVLHLLPTAYIKVIAVKVDIPLFDFPIAIPVGDQAFVFDPVRVHVPLPDIAPLPAEEEVVDFGAVPVGGGERRTVTLTNVGEARALAVALVDAGRADVFRLLTPQAEIDPEGGTAGFNVRFTPKAPGPVEATLTFVTNDPDQRFVKVTLRGNATPASGPDYPDAGGGGTGGDGAGGAGGATFQAGAAAGDDGGCGCRLPSQRSSLPASWLAAGALLALGRRRRSPPTRPS